MIPRDGFVGEEAKLDCANYQSVVCLDGVRPVALGIFEAVFPEGVCYDKVYLVVDGMFLAFLLPCCYMTRLVFEKRVCYNQAVLYTKLREESSILISYSPAVSAKECFTF